MTRSLRSLGRGRWTAPLLAVTAGALLLSTAAVAAPKPAPVIVSKPKVRTGTARRRAQVTQVSRVTFAAMTAANDLEFIRSLNVPTLRIDGMMIAGA